MSTKKPIADRLVGIYIASGVTSEGKPFCHVTAESTDGRSEGQLTPEEVRKTALDWLTAAEASIHDAAVFSHATTNLNLSTEQAAALIADLREHRRDNDETS